MGAVREMTVMMKVPTSEFDTGEFSTNARIDYMDLYVRVVEKYRQVEDPDGDYWQNRDGDTLDANELINNYTHLSRVDVRWVDEFEDA